MTYARIARTPGAVPFGWIQTPDDLKFLDPVPFELDSLELAFSYLDKGFSLRQVATWLQARTGRKLSHVRLSRKWKASKRVKLIKRLSLSEALHLGLVAAE
jgi:hypothetical protein